VALIDDDDVLMYHIPNLTHPCLVAIVPNQSIFRQKTSVHIQQWESKEKTIANQLFNF
jgi:hypothetical protein